MDIYDVISIVIAVIGTVVIARGFFLWKPLIMAIGVYLYTGVLLLRSILLFMVAATPSAENDLFVQDDALPVGLLLSLLALSMFIFGTILLSAWRKNRKK